MSVEKPTCFVIAPIGPKDSDVRKRSDKVLKHIFKKALADKYNVIRGDEIDEPGMITSQVLRSIQESPLVVADLTGHNPNVMYELAVRHAIEKPVIHLIEPRLSKIPFDIAGFRTIEFDLSDPDSIESAVEQLMKQSAQAEKGKWGETPVKLANIMQRSNQDSPEILLLKEAVDGIAEIRSSLAQQSIMTQVEGLHGLAQPLDWPHIAKPNFYGDLGPPIFPTSLIPVSAPASASQTQAITPPNSTPSYKHVLPRRRRGFGKKARVTNAPEKPSDS